jgi:transcriptional regulator with XRE-family HTH domain
MSNRKQKNRISDELRQKVAERLRMALAYRQVSAPMLSRATQGRFSEDTILRYMNAKTDPPFVAMAYLAALLGVRIEWLAYGKGDVAEADWPMTEMPT